MAASAVVRLKTFKDTFKYYKRRSSPPDLKKVIDLKNPDLNRVRRITTHVAQENSELGLKSTSDWKLYEFIDIPGLIFIENPFTANGQRYWIIKLLKDYPRPPNKLNIDPHNILKDNEIWWDVCFGNDNIDKNLQSKLRWTTLGYLYNWDLKCYSEDLKSKMPTEMAKLTKFLAQVTGFREFNAEATIVNYYLMNSTLAGHLDRSEINVEAPLFSISFGQTAIFLIGGHCQEDPADALFIRSGDIVVMSGDSRLKYHGIPKILPADTISWELDDSNGNENPKWSYEDWNKAGMYINQARINMTVRQVLKSGQTKLC